MSDEPLYCTVCGAEDGDCEHDPWAEGFEPGPYCESCGVIPWPGKGCKFHERGGRNEPCEA